MHESCQQRGWEAILHKIELRRLELGFTQAEVAILCGVSIDTICRIESETSEFKTRFDTARLIADGLESQLHTLFEPMELSHLGRPPQTGGKITHIATKQKGATCPSCWTERSLRETQVGISDCCEATLTLAS